MTMEKQSQYFGQDQKQPRKRLWQNKISRLLHRWTGVEQLFSMYEKLPPSNGPVAFVERVFDLFDIKEFYRQEEIHYIPESGASVVISNHPFGAVEGMALLKLLLKRRPDVRVLANSWLHAITELKDNIIPMNPYGGKNAIKDNIRSMREAVEWLRGGGLLVIFPAGEVAHWQFSKRRISDPQWHLNVARLIKKTSPSVVPVYFFGRNSLRFNILGMIHPVLRTVMLPRELLNKKHLRMQYAVGKCISCGQYKNMSDKELLDYLRMRTYMLANIRKAHEKPSLDHPTVQTFAAIIDAVPRQIQSDEVQALPASRCLAQIGSLKAYYAEADEVPNLLREIGRLREITFRANGEGTGLDSDLDEYDRYYLHLFVWDGDKQCIVGAYRIGKADEIIRAHGIQGLYSYSLFRYPKTFIRKILPAVELGRSFIRHEYQKSFSPLLLLWRGIATFVLQNPKYKTVFGPVSISNDYNPVSQQLLVEFLKLYNYQPELARSVKARNPLKKNRQLRRSDVASIKYLDNVSEIISLIENKNVGVPILIKQYLKLGGVMLGFNIDKSFGNSIDCLVKIDLTVTDEKILEKYMGEDGIKQFHAFHAAYYRQAS